MHVASRQRSRQRGSAHLRLPPRRTRRSRGETCRYTIQLIDHGGWSSQTICYTKDGVRTELSLTNLHARVSRGAFHTVKRPVILSIRAWRSDFRSRPDCRGPVGDRWRRSGQERQSSSQSCNTNLSMHWWFALFISGAKAFFGNANLKPPRSRCLCNGMDKHCPIIYHCWPLTILSNILLQRMLHHIKFDLACIWFMHSHTLQAKQYAVHNTWY